MCFSFMTLTFIRNLFRRFIRIRVKRFLSRKDLALSCALQNVLKVRRRKVPDAHTKILKKRCRKVPDLHTKTACGIIRSADC